MASKTTTALASFASGMPESQGEGDAWKMFHGDFWVKLGEVVRSDPLEVAKPLSASSL